MSTYTPDYWVIVEISSIDYGVVRKILAGWTGGYTTGNSWKLSSGNLPEYTDGDFIVFPQESGSVYRCHKNSQRLSGYTASILDGFIKDIGDKATVEDIKYVSE